MNSKQVIAHIPRPARPGMVGDGFQVYTYIPGPQATRELLDPFLMLDYMPPTYFSPTETPRGVDVHPHKGFETVTMAFEGSVAHYDSAGNHGIIGPGDVQWMTAGKGILHKEFHETEFARRGGQMHMLQLWVNLPARHKGAAPGYQTLLSDQIPVIHLQEGSIRLIAGEYAGIRGAANTFTPMQVWDMYYLAGTDCSLRLAQGQTVFLLVLEGYAEIQDTPLVSGDALLLGREGETLRIKTETGVRLILLSGEALREPVEQYGPFVMNTRREIQEAIAEFQAGGFGHLS